MARTWQGGEVAPKLILFKRIELGGFPSVFKRIKLGGMARGGMALDSILFERIESGDSRPCLRGSSWGDGGARGDGPRIDHVRED